MKEKEPKVNITHDHELHEDKETQPKQSREIELLPYQYQHSGYTELFPDQAQQQRDTEMIQEKSQLSKGMQTFIEQDVVTQEPTFLKCVVEAATQT